MKRALFVLTLLAAVAAPLRAQSNTAEALDRARRLYEDLEVERALVILRGIISPQSPFEVSREQRVEAYKYLGAALALQPGAAKRDSAVIYFRAAIERDPFTDLDPRGFSPTQLQAFGEARSRTFAVALRPIAPDTVDPRSEQVTFRGLSSHLAQLRVELHAGGATRRVLYEGDNEGLREASWDGLLDDGALASEGRYELSIIGRSRLIPALVDTANLFFELTHQHPPLEDTLTGLGPADLLPEQHPASAATADLLKGIGVAGAALLIQSTLTSPDLGRGSNALSGAVALSGIVTGVASFVARQRHRDIPANIAENARRQAERESQNSAIRQRNTAILRETKLIVTPATGARQ